MAWDPDPSGRFPVTAQRDALLAALRSSDVPCEPRCWRPVRSGPPRQVACLRGAAGGGKSTLVPLLLLAEARGRGELARIAVAQPRLAATVLATRAQGFTPGPPRRGACYTPCATAPQGRPAPWGTTCPRSAPRGRR